MSAVLVSVEVFHMAFVASATFPQSLYKVKLLAWRLGDSWRESSACCKGGAYCGRPAPSSLASSPFQFRPGQHPGACYGPAHAVCSTWFYCFFPLTLSQHPLLQGLVPNSPSGMHQ